MKGTYNNDKKHLVCVYAVALCVRIEFRAVAIAVCLFVYFHFRFAFDSYTNGNCWHVCVGGQQIRCIGASRSLLFGSCAFRWTLFITILFSFIYFFYTLCPIQYKLMLLIAYFLFGVVVVDADARLGKRKKKWKHWSYDCVRACCCWLICCSVCTQQMQFLHSNIEPSPLIIFIVCFLLLLLLLFIWTIEHLNMHHHFELIFQFI